MATFSLGHEDADLLHKYNGKVVQAYNNARVKSGKTLAQDRKLFFIRYPSGTEVQIKCPSEEVFEQLDCPFITSEYAVNVKVL